MVHATAFEPLWNRGLEWARRLQMIGAAREFLYLSTYYIEFDAYGRELLDALAAAQGRGVRVHLLIDGFGQRLGGVLMSASDKAALAGRLADLECAGAQVGLYQPRQRLGRWLGGGHHVKIQVSDAGDAIFGSSNVTRQSFEGWNEYAVLVSGPIARTLLQSYADLGGTVDPEHLERLGPEDACPPDSIRFDYWMCDPNQHQGACGPLGWRGRNVVTDQLLDMINQARRSIGITSFYFKPVGTLVDALIRAAGRGVRVEVHHSHLDALPATELAWIAAAAHYPRLLAAGVQVFENRHGEHSKIVLIDEASVAFGSYNFEHAAHDRLAEAMLASRDPRAVAPVLAILAELRANRQNLRVSQAALAAQPARLRFKRAALAPFKRWM